MIDEHQFVQIQDKSQNRFLEMEVNWNDTENVKGCKAIRCKIGEEKFIITQADLLAMMLTIGSAETQKKLLPSNFHRVKKTQRLLTFNWNASRNYQKGEIITIQAPWLDVIDEAEAIYAGAAAKTKKSNILIP